MEQIKEDCRDQRPVAALRDLCLDVRLGVRTLSRGPLLAAAVVLTLTFGIGLNASLFTFLNALLFRAEVSKEPASFLHVATAYRIHGQDSKVSAVSLGDYEAYRGAAAGAAELAAFASSRAWLGQDESEVVAANMVTCNYFAVFGMAAPKVGRFFHSGECGAGEPVVLLSDVIWRDRFGSDTQILGRVVHLNRQPFTVVGIVPVALTPRRFEAVWIPLSAQPLVEPQRDHLGDRSAPWLALAGRLGPGISRAQVQAALRVAAVQQDRLHPGRTTRLDVTDGSVASRDGARLYWNLAFLMGAATLVLLAVCANVAMLRLSRADSRRREMAIRLSLGAGRTRLLRMLLTESLLLSAAAGALSLWIVYHVPEVIYRLLTGFPAPYSMAPDWVAFAWLAAVTTVTGVVAGLAPAAEALKVDLTSSMKGGSGAFAAGGRSRTRNSLVAVQAAISLVLLVLAGTVVEANRKFVPIDPSLDTRHLSMTWLPQHGYTRERAVSFYRGLNERLRAMPGVISTAFADEAVQGDIDFVTLPGKNSPRLPVSRRMVSPDYFQTLGLPILAGRGFLSADEQAEAGPVAVVSRRLAAVMWPGQHAIGKTLLDIDGGVVEVVGVTGDLAASFYNSADTQLYRPLPPTLRGAQLVVRFHGEARPVAGAIANLARDLDDKMVPATYTFQAFFERQTKGLVTLVRIATALGVATLLLSIAGVSGVVSYAVNRRTRELGVRTACGATGADLFRLVILSGAKPVALGLAVGACFAIGASFGLSDIFRRASVRMEPADPIVFGASALLLLAAALVAMFGPARRAATADPVQALRQE
jgi:predicted permease